MKHVVFLDHIFQILTYFCSLTIRVDVRYKKKYLGYRNVAQFASRKVSLERNSEDFLISIVPTRAMSLRPKYYSCSLLMSRCPDPDPILIERFKTCSGLKIQADVQHVPLGLVQM